jgi:hypothetical protein
MERCAVVARFLQITWKPTQHVTSIVAHLAASVLVLGKKYGMIAALRALTLVSMILGDTPMMQFVHVAEDGIWTSNECNKCETFQQLEEFMDIGTFAMLTFS